MSCSRISQAPALASEEKVSFARRVRGSSVGITAKVLGILGSSAKTDGRVAQVVRKSRPRVSQEVAYEFANEAVEFDRVEMFTEADSGLHHGRCGWQTRCGSSRYVDVRVRRIGVKQYQGTKYSGTCRCRFSHSWIAACQYCTSKYLGTLDFDAR